MEMKNDRVFLGKGSHTSEHFAAAALGLDERRDGQRVLPGQLFNVVEDAVGVAVVRRLKRAAALHAQAKKERKKAAEAARREQKSEKKRAAKAAKVLT